jgi:hypothetical protein
MDAIWNFGDGVRDVFDVSSDDYRACARSDPRRATPHEQQNHHHQNEVIVTATKLIITRFFVVVVP